MAADSDIILLSTTLSNMCLDNVRPTFYLGGLKHNPIRAGGVIFYKYNESGYDCLLSYDGKTYSDFGGKTDTSDSCIEDTVSREVAEESNGVFEKDWTKDRLKQNPFYIKKGKYIVYFVELTSWYDPSLFGDIEVHAQIPRKIDWIPF